jgi:hypothetical protein
MIDLRHDGWVGLAQQTMAIVIGPLVATHTMALNTAGIRMTPCWPSVSTSMLSTHYRAFASLKEARTAWWGSLLGSGSCGRSEGEATPVARRSPGAADHAACATD